MGKNRNVIENFGYDFFRGGGQKARTWKFIIGKGNNGQQLAPWFCRWAWTRFEEADRDLMWAVNHLGKVRRMGIHNADMGNLDVVLLFAKSLRLSIGCCKRKLEKFERENFNNEWIQHCRIDRAHLSPRK